MKRKRDNHWNFFLENGLVFVPDTSGITLRDDSEIYMPTQRAFQIREEFDRLYGERGDLK
jgi:hypothetical protein